MLETAFILLIGRTSSDAGQLVQPLSEAGYRVSYLPLEQVSSLGPDERLPDLLLLADESFEPGVADIIEALRQRTETGSMPLLLLQSDSALKSDEESKLRTLADECLKASNDVEDLLARIRLHLAHAGLVRRFRRAELRQQGMLDHVPDVVWVYRDGRIVYINPAGVRLLGADSPDRILGRSSLDFIDPSFHDLVRKRIDAALQEPALFPIYENILVALDGTRIDVEVIAMSYRHDDGMDIQVMARDIRPRKQAEQALKESLERERGARLELQTGQEFLRMASKLGRFGAWAVDLREGKVTWSEQVYKIYEHDADQPPALEDIVDFCAPEYRDMADAAFEACARDGTPYDLEFQIITTRGKRVWVRVMAESVRDENNEIVQVQGAFQDIEHLKKLEAQQLELQRQFAAAQRMEAIGQLTGGIAHDFNNLLTVIMGNAELMREPGADQRRVHRAAGLIVDAAERGAHLTRGLLAFARRQPLAPQAMDINSVVGSTLELLERTLGADIDIELLMAEGLPLALVDPAQLGSALLNLALNARAAMPQGGRLIIQTLQSHFDESEAAAIRDLNPGNYIVLAVSDTGSGIAPEHMERLFEPFFTTRPRGKGTGLGLPMVHGFVKQIGGHVAVYSEPGEGTTVRLYLPVADKDAAPVAAGLPDEIAFGQGETILLVEDDDLVRENARDLLERLGYRVLSASNGPEAMAIAEDHADIDLLLTDIIMPGGMNGRQLAEALTVTRPELPVLYASAYTENVIADKGLLKPGFDLLVKPYRRAQLAQALRKLLDAARSEAQPE